MIALNSKFKLIHIKKFLLPIIVLTFLLFIFIQKQFNSANPSAEEIQPSLLTKSNFPEEETTEYEENTTIFVEIKGAVSRPGVYELEVGDRVLEAISLAGGYKPESDSKMINHAQKVEDEMIIYVPELGEVMEDSFNISSSNSSDQLVNINKADVQSLTTLPGVGPSKAAAIITYREESGGFKVKEDLLKVTGIGQKTFEKIEPHIKVN